MAATFVSTQCLSLLMMFCPANGFEGPLCGPQLDAAWAAGPQEPAVAVRRQAAGGLPSEVGQWQAPMAWDVIAIHAAVLPTGKVLHYSYPSGSDGSRARLWDPDTGAFTNVNISVDLFCSGLSFLADGGLYVSGGNDVGCEFRGLPVTHIFNPGSEDWTQLGDMVTGRWYPTNLTLGDGSVIITSGLNTSCELTSIMERYIPGVGVQEVPEGERGLQLYPRLHLLTSGKIAHVGVENQTFTFDPASGLWDFVDWTNLGWRCQGTSVLLPGRTDQIMIMGGDCPVTSSCEIIDFSQTEPQWSWTTSMHHPRAHADALILPDKTVLVVGGGTADLYGDPVFVPELFDPATETWTELPAHVYGRMYHATTLLLPDGRVLVSGQDNGQSMFWGEIYEPPYLFRGPRPEVTAAPQRIAYEQSFSLATPQAADIEALGLIALSTVTHSVNNSQRYVELDFTTGVGLLSAGGPLNGNHAPPGPYMLFAVNGQGVPSVARMVNIGPWNPADLTADGVVDAADLAMLLGNWGLCPGCPADLNGNGIVDAADLAQLLGSWS